MRFTTSPRSFSAVSSSTVSASGLRALCVRALCPLCLISGALVTVTAARADITLTRVFTVDRLVPDGGYLFDSRGIDLGGATVTDVDVSLVLTATAETAWAGDYFASLQHETGYSVLLNRIGKTSADEADLGFFGSNANGLSITFDDSASADVHLAPFDINAEAPATLAGTWQPDARREDPALVTTASPRSTSGPSNALLSSFNGTSTNGEWLLLVADDGYSASARLTSWSLSLTFAPTDVNALSLSSGDTLRIAGADNFIVTVPRTIDADLVNQGLFIGPTATGQAITFTGHLTGAGDYRGNFVLKGSFSPGNSPAIVDFDGSLTLDPDNELTIEIGGATPGTQHDAIHVTGSLGFGGTLNIVFIDGFAPSASDAFQLFTATSFGGSFAQVTFSAFGGYAWDMAALQSTGILTFGAIPEPAACAALLGLSALAFAARRPRRRALG